MFFAEEKFMSTCPHIVLVRRLVFNLDKKGEAPQIYSETMGSSEFNLQENQFEVQKIVRQYDSWCCVSMDITVKPEVDNIPVYAIMPCDTDQNDLVRFLERLASDRNGLLEWTDFSYCVRQTLELLVIKKNWKPAVNLWYDHGRCTFFTLDPTIWNRLKYMFEDMEIPIAE